MNNIKINKMLETSKNTLKEVLTKPVMAGLLVTGILISGCTNIKDEASMNSNGITQISENFYVKAILIDKGSQSYDTLYVRCDKDGNVLEEQTKGFSQRSGKTTESIGMIDGVNTVKSKKNHIELDCDTAEECKNNLDIVLNGMGMN